MDLSTTSFEELLVTPKSKRGQKKRKAVNSSAVVVRKQLFLHGSKTPGGQLRDNKEKNKQNKKTGDEQKKGGEQKKRVEQKMESGQSSTSKTVFCIYCGMRFENSCEKWIRCNMYLGWACVPCTDANRHQKAWVC